LTPPPPNYRPTWVEISKAAFSANISQVKKWVGRNTAVLAVLKANAYGHGARALAPVALKAGSAAIGVSSLEEGISLRESGIKAPILLLGTIYPFSNLTVAREHNLMPTISSFEAYSAFKAVARSAKKPWAFHLKVDTGMGRIGVSPEEAKKILSQIADDGARQLGGVYSHFATADSDPFFAEEQYALFVEVKRHAEKLHLRAPFHMANTAAIFSSPKYHFQMVRPGIGLYGAPPLPLPKRVKLEPVLTWRSAIVFIKKVRPGSSISYGRMFITKHESVVATLPVGYADGVPRALSNKGQVLVRGRRCPIIGRVTMDQIMIDVTKLVHDGLSIKVGESVILIGRQEKEEISAREWAAWANTIPYEIFCGISSRVPRQVRNT
jgi:alanine racemase